MSGSIWRARHRPASCSALISLPPTPSSWHSGNSPTGTATGSPPSSISPPISTFLAKSIHSTRTVNVKGTRNLLRRCGISKSEQFVYSGTMLVHRPGAPGLPITERAPVEPKWAYPQSKARAEEEIRTDHGDIPYVLMHLAGLYDETTAIPTLSHQIARIYERSAKSHAYSGSLETGQAFIHKDDMVDAFVRAVDRRNDLPPRRHHPRRRERCGFLRRVAVPDRRARFMARTTGKRSAFRSRLPRQGPGWR